LPLEEFIVAHARTVRRRDGAPADLATYVLGQGYVAADANCEDEHPYALELYEAASVILGIFDSSDWS
jgi:hypothetical protein